MGGGLVGLEGTQEGKNTCHLAVILLHPLSMMSPEEMQDVRTQDTGPSKLKNDFSKLRNDCVFPTYRKVLNSLT